jgi:hypothetical protein
MFRNRQIEWVQAGRIKRNRWDCAATAGEDQLMIVIAGKAVVNKRAESNEQRQVS